MVAASQKSTCARSRLLYLAGICALLVVLLSNLFITERQEPWEDEIFAVSTGWSLARSGPPTLSVLADYPRTGSPVLFYGPVSFEVEAWLIRVFGLSVFVWRFACFLGLPLCIIVCWALIKVAGGNKWARLTAALFIALAGSVSGPFPGRWDFIAVGLFLSGLLLFTGSIKDKRGRSLWRPAVAGIPIGFALASSPRVLTLSLAALAAMFLTALCFRKLRKRVFLGALVMFSGTVLVHTLLLLPWGLNSLSWYAFLKRATRSDYINATPLTGRGIWVLDLQHHKLLAIVFVLLLIIPLVQFKRTSRTDSAEWPLRLFLTFFASINMIMMFLLLENTLGQTAYWLPPVVVAIMCRLNWEFRYDRGLATLSAVVISVCLLLLCVEEVEQMAAVALTWQQRSTIALTAFARQHIPVGSTVYGPIGSYFYPVELSGSHYFYPFERTTPGLYSQSNESIGDKLDKEICSHPSYAMWPTVDPMHHPEAQRMPDALRGRLQMRVAEFDQPPLARWKDLLLQDLGPIGSKYGFPNVVIYSLQSRHCGNN